MSDKIQNLHDLEYYTHAQLVVELITKWIKSHPDNVELKAISKAMTEIMFYVVRLQQDSLKKDMVISDYRYKKNTALLELQELKAKYEILEL
tara:strand:+ start:80 stop:355 length:276 start_codon:yes stop_codon:yes gene_type:complete